MAGSGARIKPVFQMGKFPGPCGRRHKRPLNSHKLQPDEIPDKSGEVVMKKVTKNPTKQLFAIDSCWERKMSIFFNGVSLSIRATLPASPHAKVADQPKNSGASAFVYGVSVCLSAVCVYSRACVYCSQVKPQC